MLTATEKGLKQIIENYAKEIIKYLLTQKVTFAIVCKVSKVTFNPLLPVVKGLPDLSLFVLQGYTLESVEMLEDSLVFEAGFGENSEGSFVTVPLNSIVQICENAQLEKDFPERILFMNPFGHLEEEKQNKGVQDSMRAFLQNPLNQYLTNKG
ncbi:hypothetical protein CCZ01_05490 [Helicobacter monodelphidis]|uniref:hypothetical protein n=1 Tax=Helicobacter sp. 15-1451 TaxID=2004995 RepID=UPI000DCDA3B8|nr:hypothetical protein [Helicobacter sp. 15-1451]RAX57595.1 hypothetical protein CCZ01_05490 [Helicobacter sp. 15-1451]